MASRLSQEEDNYVRMCLLMTGISTRAARIVFDHEFAPSCLDSTLKREIKKLRGLQNKGNINQVQWNLLFRNKPDVPDSKTFDVTLMITLIRHLTDRKDLTPPLGGYDSLPLANETTPTSDLARIKFYRNFLAHLVEEKIEDTEFITAWDIVTCAISRLGGTTMKQECDYLKVKILDQSSREIILEIKRSNDEIKELIKSTESLKKANEDMSTEMKKLEMSLKDTVPWNIRDEIKEILDEWKDNDKMFITTRAANHVLKSIKENSCVTITASSGVGKTATLKHVALQMELEGYDVLLVTDPDDIIKFNNPKQKTLFVIDNLCGNYSLNQADIKVWEPVMERIKRILSKELSKIIVSCRLQVFQDEKFESLSIFKSCVCNLLSKSMCLSKAEKASIAEFYLKTKAHEIADYYDLYDCFPLLCKLYNENPVLNITDFFQNPFTVYEAEIDKLKKKGFFSKYCALALCVMFNNNLNEEILTEDVNEETTAIIENTCEVCRLDRGTSRLILQDDLNSFIQTFLKKEQNIYKTIHDKIFDFLVYYFGQKIICCLIKNANSGLIKERFLLEKENNMDRFVIVVPPKYHTMYTKRMIEDWSKGKVNDVCSNINMKIPQFRKFFLFCLNELDTSYQRQLARTCDVYNNDTALLNFCFKGDIPFIEWCFSHDVDVNQCTNNEETPLCVAVQDGRTKIVKMLLDMGANYDKCTNKSLSPLYVASKDGHVDIVGMLIDIGADYNKCNNTGWSPVMSASINGHPKVVRMLLDKGADYNKCNNTGMSPLFVASNVGHAKVVRMLLDKGADYNKCNNTGMSSLFVASNAGHVDIVRMLIDIGTDFNKCNNTGMSPLFVASFAGRVDIVRMLIDIGADYNKCNNEGLSPVNSASINGHAKVVSMLLDIGADYNKCNNEGLSPVNSASINGHAKVVSMLLDIGADYNKCNNEGWSPVNSASMNGHAKVVRMLLDIGADYNQCNNTGMSPLLTAYRYGHTEIVKMLDTGADYDTRVGECCLLMNACRTGRTEIVRKLLDIGADYNKCDNDRMSPLISACRHGHTEIVRMLLDIGANRYALDSIGRSPLKVASSHGHTEIVRLLLEKGVYFNECDSNKWSSVQAASRYGYTEIVRMLLDEGADYNSCDRNYCSPLKSACSAGHTEIVRLLLDKGADYDKCDKNSWSPLKSACHAGHTEIVRLLLDKGADYDKCDRNSWSPLKSAYSAGHTEIVKMLLDMGADYTTSVRRDCCLLMNACRDGRTEIVRKLLDIGGNMNICDHDGYSPEITASVYGHIEIVRLLHHVHEHSRNGKGT